MDYDQRRKAKAKELGVRVVTLDVEVERRRKGRSSGTKNEKYQLCPTEPEPWPDPIDGAVLLDMCVGAFERYAVLPDGAAESLALWTVFSHALDAFNACPRLIICSPDAECGKSTVLTVLGQLVSKPLPASNITPAAVFRAIEQERPTLLIDEGDTFLGERKELRGILNSGHTRSTAYVVRTVGDDFNPQSFSTWAAVAVALIGKLHETMTSRSIVIRMFRRKEDEPVESLIMANPGTFKGLEEVKRRCIRWVQDNIDELRDAIPEIPAGFHNRTADNWYPLFVIADRAGGHWPDTARRRGNRARENFAAS